MNQDTVDLRPSRRTVLTATGLGAGVLAALPLAPARASASADTVAAATAAAASGDHGWPTPFVVGHRGASAYRPEHTVASWELAARIGAEVVEPDLVPTKDGVLVCRHEPEISGTTDVAEHPEFADRRATKVIDDVEYDGWFTEDFTLAELRTLRAVERLPELRRRNTVFDGLWQVPTFDEALATRERLSAELGRTVGIVPEIKHSSYFRSLGFDVEASVVATLAAHGLNSAGAPVVVQSFELTNLVELRTRYGLRTPTVFLTSAEGAPADLVAAGDPRQYADLLIPSSLRDLARYVNQIGPALGQLTTDLVDDAHAAGLQVVPYTLRPENQFLPEEFRVGDDPADWGNVLDYAQQLFATGIDGIFTDAPDVAVVARDHFAG
ncbi:glycerophosphodiester phosphodiesterase family protein [Kineococcus sp. SYSU DK002]|uniref:glycerophosphodiester phosphodiesterase family protein n=1 Tax=Kineococcus sp. SYSU DK002 TaxID=3383123 RepID=UPI003D7EFB3E